MDRTTSPAELLAHIENLEDTISVLRDQVEELQGQDVDIPFEMVKAELGLGSRRPKTSF